MDTETLIAAVVDGALVRYPSLGMATKGAVHVSVLRKVAARALEAYQKAPYPGRAVTPWLNERVLAFACAVAKGEVPSEDKDLVPPGHAAHKRDAALDPWAELREAEDRARALEDKVLDAISREQARKLTDPELVQLNRRVSHFFEAGFPAGRAESVVGKTPRTKVVAAAAVVHEELERRGLFSPGEDFPRDLCKALYDEALTARLAQSVVVHQGKLLQQEEGVVLALADAALLLRHPTGGIPIDKLAKRFSPAGSAFHPPFIEPEEAAYEKALRSDGVDIGQFSYTTGARTDAFTELFVSGDLTGVLLVGKETVLLRKALVPYVLTRHAVESGYMPPDGESALPTSLEWDVPPELRYWKAASGADSQVLRDQLVQTGMFTEESVQLVAGVPRRTFAKRFVSEPYPADPHTFAEVMPEHLPEAILYQDHAGATLIDALAAGERMIVEPAPFERAVVAYFDKSATARVEGALKSRVPELVQVDYLLGAEDVPALRQLFKQLGAPFVLAGAPGRLFVASHAPAVPVEFVTDVLPVPEVQLDKREATVLRKSIVEDEHYVLGVVLEPDVVDAQMDTYSEDEVRRSAHRFMAKYQNAGLMHQVLVNDAVKIVESYLAPADCEIGGQPVKKGTWLLAMIVEDDGLWQDVKDGKLTGFSIGGSAIRTPET